MANDRDERDKSSSEGEKSCCTWPKVLVTAVVLIVVGVLIWQFAPIDTAINNVLPTFNNTSNDNNGKPPQVPSPTPSPTEQQVESYEFMKCSDDSISNNECCNGLDNICDLGVDDIMYATMHNAMATFEDGFLFGPNHRYQLESGLEAGYRGINLDACNCGGNHVFCHGVCSLGTRDINEVFTNINSFVNNNPTEIVFIILQINNSADQTVDLNVLYDIMLQVPGFTNKMYNHPDPSTDWPTLRKARDDNERIMLFHYNAPACDEINNPCPPGMHQYYDYATNNAWEANSLAQLRETSSSCPLSRTPGIAGTTFFGVNNFVTPPSQTSAQSSNSLQFARNRINTCSTINNNLSPNFVYVDFWFEGNIPQFTQEHNSALGDDAQRRERKLNRRLGGS